MSTRTIELQQLPSSLEDDPQSRSSSDCNASQPHDNGENIRRRRSKRQSFNHYRRKENALDTEYDSRMPGVWTTITIIAWVVMITLQFSICFTTVDQYTQTFTEDEQMVQIYSTIILAINPLGALLGFPIWERIASRGLGPFRGYRTAFLLCSVISILANALYGLGGVADSVWLVIIGRGLQGFAAATNVMYSYISITVGKRRLSEVMMWTLIAISLGFAAGPFVSFAITAFFSYTEILSSRLLSPDTTPGWLCALIYILVGVLVFYGLEEVSKETRDAFMRSQDKTAAAQYDDNEDYDKDDYSAIKEKKEKSKPSWYSQFDDTQHVLAITGLIFGIFVTATGVGALEVRIAKVAVNSWGWSLPIASLYTAGVFMCFVPFMLLVAYLSRRVQLDRLVVIISMGVATASLVFLFHWEVSKVSGIALFTAGSLFFVGGTNAAKSFLNSISIKICPPRLNGPMLTVQGNAVCLGRTMGAVLGQYMRLQDQQLFGATLLVLYCLCIIWLAVYFHRLA